MTVTTVTAEYSINGGTAVSQTYNTAPIAQGATVSINFLATTLTAGTSTVDYSITDVNGGGTFNAGPTNMATETYAKLNATPSSTPISEGFQGPDLEPAPPTGAVADNPNGIDAFTISDVSVGTGHNLGGHGNSDGCFFWDFYSIQSGSSKLVFEKLDFTGQTNNQLEFTHASAPYQSENDRLVVSVSTDCGTTWSNVWDKSGSTLNTAPAHTSRFWPEINEWVDNTVDLSAYDNSPDVIIAFEGISAYGNCLFIDDINTSVSTTTSIINNFTSKLSIYPNPVNNRMTVNFTANSSNANISIINVQGQTVKEITNNTVKGENSVEINTTDLPAGIYTLSIVSGIEATTKHFVVTK